MGFHLFGLRHLRGWRWLSCGGIGTGGIHHRRANGSVGCRSLAIRQFRGFLGLPTQSGIQRSHGGADFGGVAAGIGRIECFGGVDHGAVAGTQMGFDLLTF